VTSSSGFEILKMKKWKTISKIVILQDIPSIVDAITHTIILNSMELFDLKGDLL